MRASGGLGRIRRLEVERDGLAVVLERFAETLEAFEELVDDAASHSHWIPDRDDDPLDLVPIPLSEFRAARRALRFLEATPERIGYYHSSAPFTSCRSLKRSRVHDQGDVSV